MASQDEEPRGGMTHPKTCAKNTFFMATPEDTAENAPLSALQKEIKDPTPRSRRDSAAEHDQTDMNSEIGEAMKSEFVSCKIKTFQETYLPFALANTDPRVEGVVEHHSAWLNTVPKGNKRVAYAELEAISKTVGSLLIPGSNSKGRLTRMVPNARVSTTKGCNHRIDASLVEREAREKSPMAMTDIVVPFEFKVDCNHEKSRENKLQIISDCVHLLQDDVRRMFIYAVTIESSRVTMWYVSRSHSAKSTSFDYIKEPGTLVSILISLLFATEEELGYDPRVHLRIQNLKYSWIYQFHGTRTGEDSKPRFFLTTRSVLEPRSFCVSGRTTRIFEAHEIETKNAEPVTDAKSVIIKDVWLDEDAQTEKVIQAQLFADVDAFAGRDDWKTDPRMAHFVGDASGFMTQIEELFRDGGYKKLFLCVDDESTGKPSKSAPLEAWIPHSSILGPKLDALAEREEFTGQTTRSDVKMSSQRTLLRAETPPSRKHRDHAPKRRSFLLFKDICTTVHHLPTLGDVMTVLEQCLTTLCIMFCAGWVHRDVSVGNVMAIWNTETQRWTVKLGDLEYAKRFPFSAPGSPDPKTGTPFFMPCEVLSGRYIGENPPPRTWVIFEDDGEEKALAPLAPTPVVHNFQHDVESLYWIYFWLITARVNCADSARYVSSIFLKNISLSQARRDAFELSIASPLKDKIIPALKYPLLYLESFRRMLLISAYSVGEARAWNDLGRHGLTHSNAFRIFAKVLSARGNWAAVPLQGSRQSSQMCSNSQPARAKRQVAHANDDSELAAKARKMAPDTTAHSGKDVTSVFS